jgi:hypothetical protein
MEEIKAERVKDYNEIIENDKTNICYFRDYQYNLWYLWHPKQGFINILDHTIIVHEDKTITVKEDIVLKDKTRGNLINGQWIEKK